MNIPSREHVQPQPSLTKYSFKKFPLSEKYVRGNGKRSVTSDIPNTIHA
jgi:hypothetical protein